MSSTNDKILDIISVIPIYHDAAGIPHIKALYADSISSGRLFATEDIYLQGTIKSEIIMNSNITLLDGTQAQPSIYFINNPQLGIYRSGIDEITITSAGVNAVAISNTTAKLTVPLSTNTINTESGDLSLNPAGANINFNNKNLIGIGTIPQNAYFYDVIAPSKITTTNTTPTSIFSINVPTGTLYNAQLYVNANKVGFADCASYSFILTAKNVSDGGVQETTLRGQFSAVDSGLVGCSISATPTSTAVNILATGIGANVQWFAAARVFIMNI